MREAKSLSTRQWAMLELLLLANGLLVIVFGIFVYSDSWAAPPISNSPTPTTPAAELPVQAPAITFTPIPTWTPTPIPSPTVAHSSALVLIPTNTPTSVVPGLSATPRPTHTDTATVESPTKVVLHIAGYPQTLPLSCEARSAVDWAAHFGVVIDELEFFSRLPASDNPDLGFVGDVHGKWGQVPPNPYGVHAEPVAALLRDYGVDAQASRGLTWETIRDEVTAGRPAIVWVTGHVWSHVKPIDYTSADGVVVTVAPYEHTVMIIGYDENNVLVLDGRKVYWRAREMFLKSWAVLGSMGIVMGR
jgi:uncharacterized protein YvpB